MKASLLTSQIRHKNSYLCVGLDPDPDKLPDGIPKSAQGILEFCLQIIEKTLPFTVAYKLNTAFFESLGAEGWKVMEILFSHLESRSVFTIADAKRADIGNTSRHYARAFFENMGADAITLSPYMGFDSIEPFLEYSDKTAILLALTSNPGHVDFEMQPLANGRKLYEEVLIQSQTWERKGSLMYVVGATRSTELESVRAICQDTFLLVPGVGAQGGDLKEISAKGMNRSVGLLVNVSRSILYASSGKDFALAAAKAAYDTQQEMERYLQMV